MKKYLAVAVMLLVASTAQAGPKRNWVTGKVTKLGSTVVNNRTVRVAEVLVAANPDDLNPANRHDTVCLISLDPFMQLRWEKTRVEFNVGDTVQFAVLANPTGAMYLIAVRYTDNKGKEKEEQHVIVSHYTPTSQAAK